LCLPLRRTPNTTFLFSDDGFCFAIMLINDKTR
jgi:hypothetical protein